MKWLREIWGLFVDDWHLAWQALASLAIGALVAALGLKYLAGLVMFVLLAGALAWSVRRD